MATAMAPGAAGNSSFKVGCIKSLFMDWLLNTVQDKEKPMAVRQSNILAARGTAETSGIWNIHANIPKLSLMPFELYDYSNQLLLCR